MKRRINVSGRANDGRLLIRLSAIIESSSFLKRDEVENIVDVLADRMMDAVTGLPYSNFQLSRLKVKR